MQLFVALLTDNNLNSQHVDNIYKGSRVDVFSVIAVFSEAGAMLIRIQSLT